MNRSFDLDFKLEISDQPLLDRMMRVSPQQHQVLILRYGMPGTVLTAPLTYVDLGMVLGVPTNTIKTRLHRARLRIESWRKQQAAMNEVNKLIQNEIKELN